eukprot:3013663-Prymnesium_polylepis.2
MTVQISMLRATAGRCGRERRRLELGRQAGADGRHCRTRAVKPNGRHEDSLPLRTGHPNRAQRDPPPPLSGETVGFGRFRRFHPKKS